MEDGNYRLFPSFNLNQLIREIEETNSLLLKAPKQPPVEYVQRYKRQPLSNSAYNIHGRKTRHVHDNTLKPSPSPHRVAGFSVSARGHRSTQSAAASSPSEDLVLKTRRILGQDYSLAASKLVQRPSRRARPDLRRCRLPEVSPDML